MSFKNEHVFIVSLKTTDEPDNQDALTIVECKNQDRFVTRRVLIAELPDNYEQYTERELANVLPIEGETATRGITITKLNILDYMRYTPGFTSSEAESEE